MNKILIGIVAVLAALVGAFFIFSQPAIPRADLEKKYATAPSQFITINYPPHGMLKADVTATGAQYDTRAHIRDVGPRDAPVIVLIHGSNASLFTWEPWVKRLSGKYRVVTLDLPGHGLTGAVPSADYSQAGMTDFVKKVVDKLELNRSALGGNSMGGGVAARFAEIYPGKIAHLILVDAGGLPWKEANDPPLAFKIARMPVIGDLMSRLLPRSIVKEGLIKATNNHRIVTRQMVDQYWDFARMKGTREATMQRFALPWDNFVQRNIDHLRMPTLILWGDHDNLIPVATASQWQKAIPDSKLIIYKNVGHIPMEEVADQSAGDVDAFLSTTAAQAIAPPQIATPAR